MSKVLLIYEDYTELNSAQFVLQKVGFDCIGISTEFGTAEQVVSFNPDVVVACGKAGKVTTVGVGRRLKEMPRWTGKSVLIFSSNNQPKPEDLIKIRMDVILEAPVENGRLIQVIARLTNQDGQALIEKLIKTVAHENAPQGSAFVIGGKMATEEKVFVPGGSDPAPIKTKSFETNLPAESSEISSETGMPSAFDDLNRREQERARRQKSQFFISPEAPSASLTSTLDPKPSEQTRFGNLREKESLAHEEISKSKNSMDESVEKQEVDWSEVESQLFNLPPEASSPEKESSSQTEDVSERPISEQFPAIFPMESSQPGDQAPLKLDFGQQIRQAEDALGEKMKSYRELIRQGKAPPKSVLKKTATRKVQIELMKGLKQVELEKQDSLRREFTNALFRKK